jgi:hypothetical protein
VAFATWSRLHGEHATWLFERLPELRELPAEHLVVAPGDDQMAIVDLLEGLDEPRCTIERLVGATRVVVPGLVVLYERLVERCGPVADAPLARTLGFVLADLRPQWLEGEALLTQLFESEDDVERAARWHQALEWRMVEGCGLLGAAGQLTRGDLDS